MPSYTPILIGTDFISSASVQVTEGNGAGTLNQLLSTVGNEKYQIASVELWSDNPVQLEEPIGLISISPNGNSSNHVVIPTKSIFQIANVIKSIDTKNFPLDENTRISYNILPNTIVKFTLNIDNTIRQDNSLVKLLEKMGAQSIAPEIMKELGYKEPEEIKKWKSADGEQFKQATGEILQPQKKNYDPVKKLIVAGLVIIAGTYMLYAISNGAATSFFKKEK
jgi:hypothetical protein